MRAEDNVAKVYAQLDERLTKLIVAQPIFLVATASRQRFHDRGGSWRVVGVPAPATLRDQGKPPGWPVSCPGRPVLPGSAERAPRVGACGSRCSIPASGCWPQPPGCTGFAPTPTLCSPWLRTACPGARGR